MDLLTPLSGGAPLLLALALVAHLVLLDPVLGARGHRRLLAQLERGEPCARSRAYRRWSAWGWTVAAAALAVAALGGLRPAQLGLRAPPGALAGGGALTGAAIGFLTSLVVLTVLVRRGTIRLPGSAAYSPLLPQNRRERVGFNVLTLTAGVGEEVVYRGFLAAVLVTVAPALPQWALLALAAGVFGAAHVYQGKTGVLGTALFGAAMMRLYLESGSLLLPMLLQSLMDMRAMFLTEPEPSAASSSAGDRRSP